MENTLKDMNIRMVGLDLDGTVFNDAKIITQHTKDVLARAAAEGVVVLPATGRPECGLPEEMLQIPGIRYALTSNGARIIDVVTGETVFQQLISTETALRAIHEMRQWENCVWEVYFDGKIFVEEGEYRFIEHPDMTPALREYIHRSRRPMKELVKRIESGNIGLEKMHMIFTDTGNRNEKIKYLKKKFPELDVSCATTFNVEINSIKAGKGTGLLQLGRILGIKKEEIMACGDAANDWNMLKSVGFPVAMGNGDEQTKKLAAFVTKTNEEDGAAYAVEEFVLKPLGK